MKKNEQQEIMLGAMKVAKRVAITIICCIPVMIAFGYLTRNVITSSFVQIVIFMAFMGVVVAIEEVIARKREKNKKERIVENRDVFR